MALRTPICNPRFLPRLLRFQVPPFSFANPQKTRDKTHLFCSLSTNDAELAADLAAEVEKLNAPLLQRKEAMKKSRELLFSDFCQYHGLKAEEMEKKWRKMDDEEKWGLVKGFVSDWGVSFHPLSSRSVKELLEEHLGEENPSSNSSPLTFNNLKRVMGFSPNNLP